jgi:hypothetical protein
MRKKTMEEHKALNMPMPVGIFSALFIMPFNPRLKISQPFHVAAVPHHFYLGAEQKWPPLQPLNE